MKKLIRLREHLLAAIPGLADNPDRLLTLIQGGRVEHHRGPSLSHRYHTPIRIVISDFEGELDTIMIPLLQWLSHFEPDLDPAEAVKFNAELLSNHAWDITCDVPITERVIATVNCDEGRINVDHQMPEFPIDACPAEYWQIYLRDPADASYSLIAEWGEAPTSDPASGTTA